MATDRGLKRLLDQLLFAYEAQENFRPTYCLDCNEVAPIEPYDIQFNTSALKWLDKHEDHWILGWSGHRYKEKDLYGAIAIIASMLGLNKYQVFENNGG